MTEDTPAVQRDWAARPFILAGLLGLAGLLVYLVLQPSLPTSGEVPWRAALAAFLGFAPLMLAFTLEEREHREPLLFSLLVGLVMAGIAWRVSAAGDHYADAPFWFFTGTIAGVLALPLFQSGFHRLRWGTSYKETHFHVWTDAISGGGAFAFLGLSWLLLFLLAELFHAIRIDVLRDLTREAWFAWTFSGAAFGAALGILRNNVTILGTLQRVVMLVFAILAVPLAVALAIFLLSVALSGPDVLWEATRSATPLLLSAAVGAFVLANAVLRDSDADASGSRIQRIAAAILALGILPLALLAAVSMGARIAQHGLSPERLWGLIAVAVAVAYGVGYFVAAILSRKQGWERLRRANLHLAVGSCVLALVLALPIFDFGAISARNQVARLENGVVKAEDFDFSALRWDFGDAGRKALAALAKRGGDIGDLAAKAEKEADRYARFGQGIPVDTDNLDIRTEDKVLRGQLKQWARTSGWQCTERCVFIERGMAGKDREVLVIYGNSYSRLLVSPGGGVVETPTTAQAAGLREGSRVEVQSLTREYVTIDGVPVGPPLDGAASPLEGAAPPR